MVVPITHTPPRVGLDSQPSWVVLSEANVDVWPSPDMRPIPGRPGSFAYGLLPLRLFERIRGEILAAMEAKRLAVVERE